jgi:hypothetical protein
LEETGIIQSERQVFKLARDISNKLEEMRR